jgi:hypothetical protein
MLPVPDGTPIADLSVPPRGSVLGVRKKPARRPLTEKALSGKWHNEPDAAFDGMRMGDYFEGFINEEARQLNKTVPEIKSWQPPQRTGGRGRRKTTT